MKLINEPVIPPKKVELNKKSIISIFFLITSDKLSNTYYTKITLDLEVK
jgi:hypothetical protein